MAEAKYSDILLRCSNIETASVWVNPNGPTDDTRLDMNIELSNPVFIENGGVQALVKLSFSATLSDSNETAEQRATFKVSIAGEFDVPDRLSDSSEKDTLVKIAAMDRLYAQVQMAVKTLVGMTAVREIPLASFDSVEAVSLMDTAAKG